MFPNETFIEQLFLSWICTFYNQVSAKTLTEVMDCILSLFIHKSSMWRARCNKEYEWSIEECKYCYFFIHRCFNQVHSLAQSYAALFAMDAKMRLN